jgi:hypothetical protein
MQSYRDYKLKQLLSESAASQAYGTAQDVGIRSAGVSNDITTALYNLVRNDKNRPLLNRIYNYIRKGIINDTMMDPQHKEELLSQLPSASTGIGRLATGAERAGIGGVNTNATNATNATV